MPAPTLPIRQQLLLAMQSALLGCATADGYYYDVGAGAVILDPAVNLITGVGMTDLRPVYALTPEVGSAPQYYPSSQVLDAFRVTITGRQDVDGSDPLARMTAWESMGADIEHALAPAPDGSVWHGDLATDALLGEIQPFISVGGPVVLVVRTLSMRIWRTYGDAASLS